MEKSMVHKEESFFLNNFNLDKVFNTIEKADYLFLYYIKYLADRNTENNRVYLSALAEEMKIKIPGLSKAVENLQNKGYVLWLTDAEEGKTYVELTSKAVELMLDEKKRMENCYQKIQEEIGTEKLAETVEVLKRINEILSRIDNSEEEK